MASNVQEVKSSDLAFQILILMLSKCQSEFNKCLVSMGKQ